MDTRQLIDDLQRTLERQLERSEELRSIPLDVLQLRPDPRRWSVMEVVEHMDLSSGVYYRGLKKVYGDPKSRLRYRSDYSPGTIGAMSTKAMQPGKGGKISWRMRTMDMFEPRTAATKGWAALDEFQAMLRGMLRLLDHAKVRGIEGEKVTSTLGPILRFKAGDAFTFPIAHQQRHMLQIDRTLKAVQGSLHGHQEKVVAPS